MGPGLAPLPTTQERAFSITLCSSVLRGLQEPRYQKKRRGKRKDVTLELTRGREGGGEGRNRRTHVSPGFFLHQKHLVSLVSMRAFGGGGGKNKFQPFAFSLSERN